MSLYQAFGFTIESYLELSELLSVESRAVGEPGIADVRVVLEKVDASDVMTGESRQKWWSAVPSRNRILLSCKPGLFEITDGNRVAIDTVPDATAEDIRLFLLGSALGAIQIQRGRIPIHGGAVVTQGKAVIITGDPGAGKSTMTSALVGCGLKYLSDDVSSFEFGGDDGYTPTVYPAYPQRKLVRDACVTLGFDPDSLPVVDAGRDKFAIRDKRMWQSEAVTPGALVELLPLPAGGVFRIEPVIGRASLQLLVKHLYRRWMHISDSQLPPEDLKKILKAASKLKMFRAYVPRDIGGLRRSAALLLARVESELA